MAKEKEQKGKEMEKETEGEKKQEENKWIWVGHVHHTTSNEALLKAIERFGIVENLIRNRRSALVSFKSENSVEQALSANNVHHLAISTY